MFIKIRKVVGTIAIVSLFFVVMATITAKRVTIIEDVKTDHMIEFTTAVVVVTWLVFTIWSKYPLIEGKNPDRKINIIAILLFVSNMFIAYHTPDDGVALIVSDLQGLIIVVGILTQPIIDFFELFVKIQEKSV